MNLPVGELWSMQNGYAMGTQNCLGAIGRYLGTLTKDEIDILRGKLRIGIQRDVEVTEAAGPDRPRVSQWFCSALPVAYSVSVRCAPPNGADFDGLVSTIDSGHLGALYGCEAEEAALAG